MMGSLGGGTGSSAHYSHQTGWWPAAVQQPQYRLTDWLKGTMVDLQLQSAECSFTHVCVDMVSNDVSINECLWNKAFSLHLGHLHKREVSSRNSSVKTFNFTKRWHRRRLIRFCSITDRSDVMSELLGNSGCSEIHIQLLTMYPK